MSIKEKIDAVLSGSAGTHVIVPRSFLEEIAEQSTGSELNSRQVAALKDVSDYLRDQATYACDATRAILYQWAESVIRAYAALKEASE